MVQERVQVPTKGVQAAQQESATAKANNSRIGPIHSHPVTSPSEESDGDSAFGSPR